MRGPWFESYPALTVSYPPPLLPPILFAWSAENPGPTFERELERACFGLERWARLPHLWDPKVRVFYRAEHDAQAARERLYRAICAERRRPFTEVGQEVGET